MKDNKRKSLTIRKHKKSDQRGKGKSLTGKEAQIIQGNNAVEHIFLARGLAYSPRGVSHVYFS
jgi:hypothetical protein